MYSVWAMQTIGTSRLLPLQGVFQRTAMHAMLVDGIINGISAL
jgi:hypothetical protein